MLGTASPAQTRATIRTPNDWHALYIRSVRPHLTPADITWLTNVDRTPSALHRAFGLLRALIGGAR